MLEIVEKLLILQDRDRRIRRAKAELEDFGTERTMLQGKAKDTQGALEAAKNRIKQLESDRKNLELEVEAKKEQISRYANQQLQTRKNEEYRALSKEIDTCKEQIRQIEDRELDLMEQTETAHKEMARAAEAANAARKLMEEQLAKLDTREANLRKELADLESNRLQLAGAVEESARSRYERLLRNKGENVIVGVQHGVCGGCHMRVPAQVLLACQQQQELVSCTNCGRILYYSRDMDLAVAD